MLFSISLNVFILFIHFSLLDNPLCKNNINDISNIEGPRGQPTGPINQANDRSILATHTKQKNKHLPSLYRVLKAVFALNKPYMYNVHI